MLRDAVLKEQKKWTIGRVLCVPFLDDMPLLWRASLVAAFLVQIVLLIKSVWLFRERINPDAIVYLRIAGYYLNGQTDLDGGGGLGAAAELADGPVLLVFEDRCLRPMQRWRFRRSFSCTVLFPAPGNATAGHCCCDWHMANCLS